MATLMAWASRLGAGTVVELVCPHTPQPRAFDAANVVVQLDRCLAECPVAVPLELLAMEIAEVIVRVDTCISPSVNALVGQLRAVKAELNVARLTIVDLDDGIENAVHPCHPYRESAMVTATRRGLLGLKTRRRQAPSSDGVAETVHPHLPNENATIQQRLRNALRHLVAMGEARVTAGTQASQVTQAVENGATTARTIPAPGLVVTTTGCTMTGICVEACPDDALTLVTKDSSGEVWSVAETVEQDRVVHGGASEGVLRTGAQHRQTQLIHDPGRCSGCRRCLAVCPVAAFDVVGRASWADLVTDHTRVIATATTKLCRKCRSPFTIAEGDNDRSADLCPTCRVRAATPFGSLDPAMMVELMKRGHNPDHK